MNNLSLLAGGTRHVAGTYMPFRPSRNDLGITLSDQWCCLTNGDFTIDESWFPWTELWNVSRTPTPIEVGSLIFCPPEHREVWYRSPGSFRLLPAICAGINGVALFDYARRIGIEHMKVPQQLIEETRRLTLDPRWRQWAVNPYKGYSRAEVRRQVAIGVSINSVPRANHINTVYSHNDLERREHLAHGLDEAEKISAQGRSGFPIHGLSYRNLQRIYLDGGARKLNVLTGVIYARSVKNDP